MLNVPTVSRHRDGAGANCFSKLPAAPPMLAVPFPVCKEEIQVNFPRESVL